MMAVDLEDRFYDQALWTMSPQKGMEENLFMEDTLAMVDMRENEESMNSEYHKF